MYTKYITYSQRRFLEWCVINISASFAHSTCMKEVLKDGNYLRTGNWRRRLNEIRDEHLDDYLKIKKDV